MSTNPYPIKTSTDAETVATLRGNQPVTSNSITNFDAEQIRQDAASTRIVVHHKFPELVQAFLEHKRTHGSAIEKGFYKTATEYSWQQQTARLVEKRPRVFVGGGDLTLLRNGREVGNLFKEWDRVGTDAEVSSRYLKLEEYLSYDEIMLSSLLGVSGPSHFINDGTRYNNATPGNPGTFENRGIIIGLVGARFERADRMDSVFCQKPVARPRQHPELTSIFANFFGAPLRHKPAFNYEMYNHRMRITIDILLLEASERARDAGRKAYVHVVGLGLGVWQVDRQQSEVYLEGFMDALDDLGDDKMKNVGTLNFSWVDVKQATQQMAKSVGRKHGIDVIFSRREPAGLLPPDKKDQLLVLSYAWDGNALPGNEYWMGSLSASGDPAAACMSTISELHNPWLNRDLCGNIKILS